MPAPIDKIGAKVIAPTTETKSGGASRFKDLQRSTRTEQANPTDQLPPLKEIAAAEKKTIERDLRKRIERTGTQDPGKLFDRDLQDLRKKIDATAGRIEASGAKEPAAGVRDRLSAIEAQFTAAGDKLKKIPDTNNLRDLLSMQGEMYKMSQNIEILSKVVDAATQGIKQTLQIQV